LMDTRLSVGCGWIFGRLVPRSPNDGLAGKSARSIVEVVERVIRRHPIMVTPLVFVRVHLSGQTQISAMSSPITRLESDVGGIALQRFSNDNLKLPKGTVVFLMILLLPISK
jgi:hypothetical protein